MTTFLNELTAQTNLTHTENGAVTNKSSLNAVVDFFGLAGGMRQTPQVAADLFDKAYEEDPQTALRILFYLRDIRGGQGERDIFRAGMRRYAVAKPGSSTDFLDQLAVFKQNLRLVSEYGRWDDLFFNGVTEPVVEIIRDQLRVDALSYSASPTEQVSLLAKWLPSENASSLESKKWARQLATALDLTPAQYRRMLSRLRGRIRLLEQDMSAKRWNEIDYGKLPSQAHRKHVKAFHRNSPERYSAYLESVEKGEAKINVSTVYPYEIYTMVRASYGEETKYANVAWENLPDYAGGKNALVMADVSGSMSGMPMAVSVSLALYFAERNTGAFAGHFMTFSANPQLVKVTGKTLEDRINNIERAEWGMNTNLMAAFRAILAAAKNAEAADVPEVLYIISDMEFDMATRPGAAGSWQRQVVHGIFGPEVRRVWVPAQADPNDTVFRTAKAEFTAAGLTLPHVVFWNVNAHSVQTPATILDGQVSLVSGCSPTIFAMAVQGKTPLELVHEVVNSDRYRRIIA